MKYYRIIVAVCVFVLVPSTLFAFTSSDTINRTPCESFTTSQRGGTTLKVPFSLSWTCEKDVLGYWAVLKRGNDIYFSGPVSRSSDNKGTLFFSETLGFRLPPKDGKSIEVEIWYQIGVTGNPSTDWKKFTLDYVTEGRVPSVDNIIPKASSTITSSTQVFAWTPVLDATEYWVDVGTAKGKTDIYSGMSTGNGVEPKATVSKIPQNGKPIYLRLWYKVGTTNKDWLYQDFFYNTQNVVNVAGGVTFSNIQTIRPTPEEGVDITQTFSWNAVAGVKQYGIEASQVALGGNELTYKVVSSPAVTITNINLDKNLYLRIWYQVSGVWKSQDFTYYK